MPWRKGNRLRTVAEPHADPATRRIFDELKAALGFPGLQLYYPALATYPRFLALHWETVRSVAGSLQLFAAADCLRAEAYTRAHNYFRIPDLSRTSPSEQLMPVADYFHYHDPLTLLLFVFQVQAMEGAAGKPPDGSNSSHDSLPSKRVWEILPGSIPDQEASPQLRRRYEEIRRKLATPFVGPEFCAFATDSEFLDRYWSLLTQMHASPLYPACKHGLRSSAWSLASELPGPAELTLEAMTDAGLATEDIASVARILELFIDYLVGSLLNVAAAKIAVEGGNLVAGERLDRSEQDQPAA